MQAATTAYSVYGHASTPALHTLAFKAEYFDTAIDGFMLGQGYRSYSPTLMRFRSADSCSPFERGGINAYAYCTGDPVNRTDPDGHADITGLFFKKIRFPPAPSRGGQLIRALATQMPQAVPPAPPAAGATNMTPHEQVQRFNQMAAQRLQQAQPVVTQQRPTTHQINSILQARRERTTQLRGELNRLETPAQPSAHVERSAPSVIRIRQTQDHLSDNQRQP